MTALTIVIDLANIAFFPAIIRDNQQSVITVEQGPFPQITQRRMKLMTRQIRASSQRGML
jgi:hypothetical protein